MLKYSINRPITNVVVFGCGGTGSRTVPLLAQLLTSHEFTKNVRLVLVDGDVIEEKNCKRQHFIKQEIDKNKAEVLARRYRLGFEARTEAVPFFVPSVEDQMAYLRCLSRPAEMMNVGDATRDFFKSFAECFSPVGMDQSIFIGNDTFEYNVSRHGGIKSQLSNVMFSNTSVFIMCVDSVDARKRILTLIQTLAYMFGINSREAFPNMIVIDSGNEDIFGQVSYFNPVVPTMCPFPELLQQIPDRVPFSTSLRYVPFPVGKYMHMKEGESTKSCADLDQTLAINNLMAGFIAMVFQNLLYGLEMDYHTVNCNLNGSFYTDKMNIPWLKGVLGSDRNYMRAVAEQMLGEPFTDEGLDFMFSHDEKSQIHKVPMYFGMERQSSASGFGIQDLQANGVSTKVSGKFPIGERMFLYTGDREADIRQFSETPPGMALKDEVLHLWKYSNYAYTNWANLVWPVVMQGMNAGFLENNEVLKKYAVLCSGATLGPATLSKGIDESGIYGIMENCYEKNVFDHTGENKDKDIWAIHRSDLVSFGKQDISSPSYKDVIENSLAVAIRILDGKKVVLPNDGKSLVAGCSLMFNTYNHPHPSTRYHISPFLVICEAVIRSMKSSEIREVHSALKRRLTESGHLTMLMKTVETVLLSKINLLNTVSAVIGDRGGITVSKKDRWGFMTSSTKGIPVIYDYEGGLFGGSLNDASFFITHTGSMIKSSDLEGITVSSMTSEIKTLLESA